MWCQREGEFKHTIPLCNLKTLRIWEQIVNKSVESLKKTELEQLLEEQRSQAERLAGIESVLLNIQDKLNTDKWRLKQN